MWDDGAPRWNCVSPGRIETILVAQLSRTRMKSRLSTLTARVIVFGSYVAVTVLLVTDSLFGADGLVQKMVPTQFRELVSVLAFVVATLLVILVAETVKYSSRNHLGRSSAVYTVLFAVTAIMLTFPAFLKCQPRLLGASADTAGLFVMSFRELWNEGACDGAVPLAVQMGRVFGAFTLSAAVVVLVSAVSKGFAASWSLRRASTVIVVIGVDECSSGYVKQLISALGRETAGRESKLAVDRREQRGRKSRRRRETHFVVLTSQLNRPCIEELAAVGAHILHVDIDSKNALIDAIDDDWNVAQVYLVAKDHRLNEKRRQWLDGTIEFTESSTDEVPNAGVVPSRWIQKNGKREKAVIPARIVIRTDDVWLMESARRNHLGTSEVAVDVVGQYEATAERLLRPLCDPAGVAASCLPTESDPDPVVDLLPIRTVVLCGSSPLVLAVMDWISQMVREARVIEPGCETILAAVIAEDATDLVDDHNQLQSRFGGSPLAAVPHDSQPTLRSVVGALSEVSCGSGDPNSHANLRECAGRTVIILCDDPSIDGRVLGPRLFDRFPDVEVFVHDPNAWEGISTTDGVGSNRFRVQLAAASDNPQVYESWYRMGQLLHARYLKSQRPKIKEAIREVGLRRASFRKWDDLDDLYREDNIRACQMTFRNVRKLGHTWNGVVSPGQRMEIDVWNPDALEQSGYEDFERLTGLTHREVKNLAERESESWVACRRAADPPWVRLDPSQAVHQSEGESDQDFQLRSRRAQVLHESSEPRRHVAICDWGDLDAANKQMTIGTVMEIILILRDLGYVSVPESGVDRG